MRWVGSSHFTEEVQPSGCQVQEHRALPRKPCKPTLGKEQNSVINRASLLGLEACLGRSGGQHFPGVKLPPLASGSFLAMVEAHAGMGTSTERCLSLAVAGERLWKAAGRPTLARRAAPPHCSGLGVAASTRAAKAWWKPAKHSQTQPGFH